MNIEVLLEVRQGDRKSVPVARVNFRVFTLVRLAVSADVCSAQSFRKRSRAAMLQLCVATVRA